MNKIKKRNIIRVILFVVIFIITFIGYDFYKNSTRIVETSTSPDGRYEVVVRSIFHIKLFSAIGDGSFFPVEIILKDRFSNKIIDKTKVMKGSMGNDIEIMYIEVNIDWDELDDKKIYYTKFGYFDLEGKK